MSLESVFASAMPLAARMRPQTVLEILGQKHLLKSGGPLSRLLKAEEQGANSSVILWGPPGTGKTSIAQVIALTSNKRFEELSAITAGVKEVREVIERAKSDSMLYRVSTVLFLDEIHRFSKAQQDSLLPAVEAGWITLVAATTENPSFSVIAPLLSRAVVLKVEPLSDFDLLEVLNRAMTDPRGLAAKAKASEDALLEIVSRSGGDARRALTILDASAYAAYVRQSGVEILDIEIQDVDESFTRGAVRYDRAGDQHYDVISLS